jgi:hypothetical protein
MIVVGRINTTTTTTPARNAGLDNPQYRHSFVFLA